MNIYQYETYLEHHGIKGQKWGIRRYQNPDGSLTPEGRKRYNVEGMSKRKLENEFFKQQYKIHSKYSNEVRYTEDGKVVDDPKNKKNFAKLQDAITKSKALEKQYKDMGYGDFVDISRPAEIHNIKKQVQAVVKGSLTGMALGTLMYYVRYGDLPFGLGNSVQSIVSSSNNGQIPHTFTENIETETIIPETMIREKRYA